MTATDLTMEILQGIHEQTRDLRALVQALRAELAASGDAMRDRFDRVERRQADAEVRLAIQLCTIEGAARERRRPA